MRVLEYLNDRHVNFNVLPHDDTFDSQHLAEAVHVSGRQVAKTVLLRMDTGIAMRWRSCRQATSSI